MIEVITSPTHVRIGRKEAVLGLGVLALAITATALVIHQNLRPRLK